MKKQTSPGIHLVKRKGQYYWRLVGKNGRQLARSSETYTRKANGLKSVAAAQKIFAGTISYTDWTGEKPVTRPIKMP